MIARFDDAIPFNKKKRFEDAFILKLLVHDILIMAICHPCSSFCRCTYIPVVVGRLKDLSLEILCMGT